VTGVVDAVIDPDNAANNVAGTFTASTSDPMVIVMAADTALSAMSITFTMAPGVPVPFEVGQVLLSRNRAAQ
jgi:hypothetical protein